MIEDIIACNRARIPVVWFVTHEEDRTIAALQEFAKTDSTDLWIWSITSSNGHPGWEPGPETPAREHPFDKEKDSNEVDALRSVIEKALYLESEVAAQQEENSRIIAVFKDPHHFLENAAFLRTLRDATRDLRKTEAMVVCISPDDNLPIDLKTEVPIIYPGLPHKDILKAVLKHQLEEYRMDNFPKMEELAEACVGLTVNQASDALSKSLTSLGKIDTDFINGIKTKTISAVPGLTYIGNTPSMEDAGGLDGLKQWLEERKKGFTQEARDVGLPVPKGILLLGVQGCLRGDTPIWDPVKMTNWSISYRHSLGETFNVISKRKDGQACIATAMPPIKYQKEKMIKFSFDNGEEIVVTPQHQFWNGSEWVFAGACAELHHEGIDVLLQTSSGNDLSNQLLNVHHLNCKVLNSLNDYHLVSHFYDEQPQEDLKNDLNDLRLQDDAPVHNPENLNGDDQDYGLEHNHKHQLYDHLSKPDCFLQQENGENLYQTFLRIYKRGSEKYEKYQQSHPESSHFDRDQQLQHLSLESKSRVFFSFVAWLTQNIDGSKTSEDGSQFLAHEEYDERALRIDQLEQQLLSKLDPNYTDQSLSSFAHQLNISLASIPLNKEYTKITKAELVEAEEYYDFHVPIYNSYLAAGVWNHNCGKSLFAKAVSSFFGNPLICLNPPDLKGGIVGETERNFRRAREAIEAIGNCVTGDTWLELKDGREITILQAYEEFTNPIEIKGFSTETGESIYLTMHNILKRPLEERQLLEIQLESGKSIKVTTEHQFLIQTDEGPEWKMAKDLTEEDTIIENTTLPKE